MKLARSIEQWRAGEPQAIAAGSNAQVVHALFDAKHDILGLDAENARLRAASRELSVLLSEGVDLCVRARRLDSAIPRPGDNPMMTQSATPALWVQEQYDHDLTVWEAKARAALEPKP